MVSFWNFLISIFDGSFRVYILCCINLDDLLLFQSFIFAIGECYQILKLFFLFLIDKWFILNFQFLSILFSFLSPSQLILERINMF